MKTQIAAILLPCLILPSVFGQGTLTPPGAPAPTMKSLDQIEPRTPILTLPVTITNSGSYYLSTNLTGLSGTNGITIAASHVTIDLAGFALMGVPGATTGVNIPSIETNIVIANGTIRGWGNLGVFATVSNGRFERLNFSDDGTALQTTSGSLVVDCMANNNLNGFFVGDNSTIKGCICVATSVGVVAGDACIVEGCTVTGSGFSGITAGNGCTIKDCTTKADFPFGIKVGDACTLENCAAFSSTTGIVATVGCTLRNCTAKSNGSIGINVTDGSTLTACSATGNGTQGIQAGTGCTITGCSSALNSAAGIAASSASTISGCSARFNTTDGIVVDFECQVINNDSAENGNFGGTGSGIHATGSNNRIDGNHLSSNITRGIWVPTVNGTNVIARNTVGPTLVGANFVIAAGNDIGPIGTATNSTSPWANISH